MDSHSKIPLPIHQVEKIIAAHFAPGVRLAEFEELRDGMFNAAARLALSDGRKMVLKAAPPLDVRVMRYEDNLMRAEVESMRLVRAQTSLPVPEILVYDTSRRLLPSDFFLMSYLPGAPFNKIRAQMSPEDQRTIENQVGRMAREMNQITGPRFGYWSKPQPAGTNWRETFDQMVQDVLQDGLDMQVDLGRPYEQVSDLIRRNLDALDEVDTPRLVHWDLWDGNIFVDPETVQVTGLIDFERVLWGDPISEAFLMLQPAESGFVEGYGEDLLGSPTRRRRRLLYDVYLFLILIIECYFRHYPNHDQENWARSVLPNLFSQLK